MKKRKRSAHLNIKIAKRQKRVHRWHQKLPNFACSAYTSNSAFFPRIKEYRSVMTETRIPQNVK